MARPGVSRWRRSDLVPARPAAMTERAPFALRLQDWLRAACIRSERESLILRERDPAGSGFAGL